MSLPSDDRKTMSLRASPQTSAVTEGNACGAIRSPNVVLLSIAWQSAELWGEADSHGRFALPRNDTRFFDSLEQILCLNIREERTMRGKSALLAIILILAILLAAVGGIFWIFSSNYLIDFHLYPKDTASMDLREEDISIAHYDALRQKLPECDILWNVPFQNGKLPSDTTVITVDTLSGQDVAVIAYFPELETVHAEDCRDYDNLNKLREAYPDLTVLCQVTLDGTTYPADTDTVELRAVSEEDLALLPFLTKLRTVIAVGGEEPQDLSALRRYCLDNGLAFQLKIGAELVDSEAETLTVEKITDADLSLLGNLPNLKTLHMVNPVADPAALTALPETYPGLDISWEVHIGDKVCRNTDTEIDQIGRAHV